MSAATADGSVDGLPDQFDEWPVGARRAYLEATLDRDGLLELVGRRVGPAGASGDLTKPRLARVAVEFGGEDGVE